MENGPLILYRAAPDSETGALLCTDKFTQAGLGIIACPDFSDILRRIRLVPVETSMPVVIILDVCSDGDVTLVSTLRTLYGGVGIVVLVNRDDDDTTIRLLHAGADAYCFAHAAPELLVATVLRLVWRLGVTPQLVPSPVAPVLPETITTPWKLMDTGWALRSPSGKCVALTTGERAFMVTLLNAPRLQATHAELTLAVNNAYNIDDRITHQSRMGVMVSRLRRKFEGAGIPLPLKSIHNWGYMFVVPEQGGPGSEA